MSSSSASGVRRGRDGNTGRSGGVAAIARARVTIAEQCTLKTGQIIPTGAPTAPAGWLLCDGSLLSRVTYSALFAAIGTAFGAGDGSTTFKLPDLRGRVPIGAGTGTGLTARTLGTSAGTETHTITQAQMPAHSHMQFQVNSGQMGEVSTRAQQRGQWQRAASRLLA